MPEPAHVPLTDPTEPHHRTHAVRSRGGRIGVETDARGVVGGLGANPLPTSGLYSDPATNLPALFGSAALGTHLPAGGRDD